MFLHTATSRVMRSEQNWLGGKAATGSRHSANMRNPGVNTKVTEVEKKVHGELAIFSVTFPFKLRDLRVNPGLG